MKHRFFGGTLALCLLLTMAVPAALAASYGDIAADHWAAEAVDRWSGYGIVTGDSRGFRPDDNMTRAEAAAVFARLLGLSATEGALTFPDVAADAWYADAIAKVTAAGIMNGMDGRMQPDAPVTREQFFVMFARALGMKEQASTSGAASDGGAWSAGWINALTDRGYVRGDGAGVNALSDINRASVMSLMNQTVTTYANTPGETLTASGSGVTLIAAKDVTLSGNVGDLVVSAGAASGGVTLKDATVSGTLTVLSEQVKLTVDKDSTVATVEILSDSVTVEGAGKVERVDVHAENASIDVSGASITVDTGIMTTTSNGKAILPGAAQASPAGGGATAATTLNIAAISRAMATDIQKKTSNATVTAGTVTTSGSRVTVPFETKVTGNPESIDLETFASNLAGGLYDALENQKSTLKLIYSWTGRYTLGEAMYTANRSQLQTLATAYNHSSARELTLRELIDGNAVLDLDVPSESGTTYALHFTITQ